MNSTGQGASQAKSGGSSSFLILDAAAGPHWDALSHQWLHGKMYNGFDPEKEVTTRGAHKLDISILHSKVVTRGVLLDIARYKGVEFLQPGYVITPEDLEGAAKAQNVEVRSGDALLVRTGWWPQWQKNHGNPMQEGEPGLGMRAAEWVVKKQIAALAADTGAVEVIPVEKEYLEKLGLERGLPIHADLLPNYGLLKGDQFYLEDLAKDCAEDGVYEFFFAASPLRVVGAPVMVVNAQAIK